MVKGLISKSDDSIGRQLVESFASSCSFLLDESKQAEESGRKDRRNLATAGGVWSFKRIQSKHIFMNDLPEERRIRLRNRFDKAAGGSPEVIVREWIKKRIQRRPARCR